MGTSGPRASIIRMSSGDGTVGGVLVGVLVT